MRSTSVTVSAPGSLMLFGEHGVLRGHPALTAAVGARLYVTAQWRQDREVHLRSALGHYASDLDQLETHPHFRFVLKVLERERRALSSGLDLDIQSEFPSTIGFGSSAAVTVATLGALSILRGEELAPGVLCSASREVIRAVQGIGSGADAAASAYGGLVRIESDTVSVQAEHIDWVFTAVYAGYKVATPEVIGRVDALSEAQSAALNAVFSAQAVCTDAACRALRWGDHRGFGQLMNVAQGFHESLGVSDATLSEIVYALRQSPGVQGSKISGSGLGDCVLALGAPEGRFQRPTMQVTVSAEGVRQESR